MASKKTKIPGADFALPGRQRLLSLLVSVGLGLILLAVLSFTIDPCSSARVSASECSRFAGDFLLDRNIESNTNGAWTYPFTVQNLIWLIFFMGLSEVWVRWKNGNRENAQIDLNLLPEDPNTMLRASELGKIYKRVQEKAAGQVYFLQRLISRSILQFQSSGSIDQANSILNSSLELYQHEIEMKYNMLKYVTWVIPTLGFIGTIIGIALALGEAGRAPDMQTEAAQFQPWMQSITEKLGVAFYTTLLALIISAVLVFLLHIVQAREEMALNRAGQYCLDNLINRLYES